MLADCSACDPRNSFPGQVLPSRSAANLHTATTEIDYKDRDVSVESIMQVLTGYHPPGTPPSRRLDSNANSTVLIYLTGHGGDGFLKFHDQSELLATDLATAIKSMHSAGRYKELLLVLDTCQAATLYSELDTVPHWAGISSSKLGQSSYALRSDPAIGAHLVDEFSHYLANFLDKIPIDMIHTNKEAKKTSTPAENTSNKKENKISRGGGSGGPSLEQMISNLKLNRMSSEIAVESTKLGRPLDQVKVLEFFGDTNYRNDNADEDEGWVLKSSGGGGNGRRGANAAEGGLKKKERIVDSSGNDVESLHQEERGKESVVKLSCSSDSAAAEINSLYEMLLDAWP